MAMKRRILFQAIVSLAFTSDFSFRKIVSAAHPILFEAGFSNLVYEYIFGLLSVAYCCQVTVALTSGLSSKKTMSAEYLLYYLRYESNIWCVDTSCGHGVSHFVSPVTVT